MRSFAYVGQCPASLVNSNLDAPTMKKEEINLLKYRLKHLERDNTELAKELNLIKEALQEVQESILHQDKELQQAKRWIETLEQ